MSKLDEIIYQVEREAKLFESSMGTTLQEVMGERRPCCMMCGDCPAALLQMLKAARAALSPQQRPKPAVGTDATKPIKLPSAAEEE